MELGPKDQRSIVGQRIKRLLQTPSESMGVIIEELGEAFWIYLVAELENGQIIQVGEYEWSIFQGNLDALIPAELTQEEFTLSDIEGKMITDVRESGDDGLGFAIVLENGLHFNCQGGPGGNGPFIFRPEHEE